MKSSLAILLAIAALSSTTAAQGSHSPTVLANWVGFETVVGPPVSMSSEVTVGSPIYGRATVSVYADPTLAAIWGVAFLSPGPQTSIENSISGAQGQAGNYRYMGSLNGMVSTNAVSGAGMLAQISDPVDAFASVQATYSNNCEVVLVARASIAHTDSSPFGGLPSVTPGDSMGGVCEKDDYLFNANCNGVILVRSYTGGYVFVRASASVTSSTILDEM